MPRKSIFGSLRLERVWARERRIAYMAGRGDLPLCNLCDRPVPLLPRSGWQESHEPVPKALGGKATGIAHTDCNQKHGHDVVTPMVARVKRIRKRHLGIKRPGLGRHPMRAGVLTRETKTFRHGLKPRQTLAEKHAAMIARRYPLLIDNQPQPQE